MRHSSWTLFLVPLALPLILLCIPGAMKSLNQGDPTAGVDHEYLQEGYLPGMDAPTATSSTGEDTLREASEAFFKD